MREKRRSVIIHFFFSCCHFGIYVLLYPDEITAERSCVGGSAMRRIIISHIKLYTGTMHIYYIYTPYNNIIIRTEIRFLLFSSFFISFIFFNQVNGSNYNANDVCSCERTTADRDEKKIKTHYNYILSSKSRILYTTVKILL